MELSKALDRLTALSHAGRLEAFKHLVRAGQGGVPAGELAKALGVAPNTLSAQLNILSASRLIRSERDGRSIIYQADLSALNEVVLYLIEDCCEGRDEVCAPILEALQSVRC